MSDSVASRYADAVARIQARRRMRLSGLPVSSTEASRSVVENSKSEFVTGIAKRSPSVTSTKSLTNKVLVSTGKEVSTFHPF